jgi:hypothetical protein
VYLFYKVAAQKVAVFPEHWLGGPTAFATVLRKVEKLDTGLGRMTSVNSYGGTPVWNAAEWSLKCLKAFACSAVLGQSARR